MKVKMWFLIVLGLCMLVPWTSAHATLYNLNFGNTDGYTGAAFVGNAGDYWNTYSILNGGGVKWTPTGRQKEVEFKLVA